MENGSKSIVFSAFLLCVLLFSNIAQASTLTEAVVNGNFEGGVTTDWTQASSCITASGIMSGAWLAYIGIYNTSDSIIQSNIDLPGNATSITLSFDYMYWDDDSRVGGYGAVSLHNPDTAAVLSADYFQEADDTGVDIWNDSVDLTDLRGQTVDLMFSVINGGSYDNRLLVDNVSIIIETGNSQAIYRLYNTLNGAYLYTRGSADRDHVLNTWPEFEFTDGVPAFYAPLTEQAGLTPMYRLYNTLNGAYLYTRGDADKAHVLNTWPEFEFTDGIPAFYASLTEQDGLTPIYRLYNTLNGMYLYTRGDADKTHVMSTWPEFEFTDGVPAFYASLTL